MTADQNCQEESKITIQCNLEQVQVGTEVSKSCLTYSTVSVLTQMNYNGTQLWGIRAHGGKKPFIRIVNPSHMPVDQNKKRTPNPSIHLSTILLQTNIAIPVVGRSSLWMATEGHQGRPVTRDVWRSCLPLVCLERIHKHKRTHTCYPMPGL